MSSEVISVESVVERITVENPEVSLEAISVVSVLVNTTVENDEVSTDVISVVSLLFTITSTFEESLEVILVVSVDDTSTPPVA